MRDNGTHILLAGWEIPIVNQSGYESLNLEKQLWKGVMRHGSLRNYLWC